MPAGPPGSAALRGALLTVGILCIVPQGLVPIGFNLLGVDQQVKIWFAARYLEQDLQTPAAAAFIAVGLPAILFAEAISRPRGAPGDQRCLPAWCRVPGATLIVILR